MNMGLREIGKTTKRYVVGVAVSAAFILSPTPAFANNILGLHDWSTNDNPTANTWVDLDDNAVITLTDLYAPAETDGNPGGWLQIDYDATTDIGPYPTDYIYTPSEELFSGTWDDTMSINFDFWASNTVPALLQVVWHTTNASDNIWSFALTDPGTNSWTDYIVSLAYDEALWTGTGIGDESQYLADLADIDWIGIGIRRFGTSTEFYGIDNFALTIPEPAEIFMLAAALITSAGSFRRKKKKKANVA